GFGVLPRRPRGDALSAPAHQDCSASRASLTYPSSGGDVIFDHAGARLLELGRWKSAHDVASSKDRTYARQCMATTRVRRVVRDSHADSTLSQNSPKYTAACRLRSRSVSASVASGVFPEIWRIWPSARSAPCPPQVTKNQTSGRAAA